MLWIKAEGTCGDSIDNVARAAVELAKKLGVGVTSNVNGYYLIVTPSSIASDIVGEYHDWVKRK